MHYVADGTVNSARYPDYHKLDIRVDKKFYFDTWTLTMYIDLWIVYNRSNVLAYSEPLSPSSELESQRIKIIFFVNTFPPACSV